MKFWAPLPFLPGKMLQELPSMFGKPHPDLKSFNPIKDKSTNWSVNSKIVVSGLDGMADGLAAEE